MNLRDEVELFIDWLESENLREKQYSVPNTLRAYRQNLEHFFEFVAPKGAPVAPAGVTGLHVKRWTTSGRGEDGGNVKPRTINQRLAALRAFYKYLKQERPGFVDPTEGIRFARVPRGEAKHVTDEHGTSLLTYVWNQVEDPESKMPLAFRMRDALLLEILWLTGGRVSEVAGLDTESIELTSGAIRIHYQGKGGKKRVIPIPLKQKGKVLKKAWDLKGRIRNYLMSARPKMVISAKEAPALFLGKNGTRLTTRSIERMLEKYTKLVGLPSYTPHSLRHGAATKLLEYEVDLKTISEILGHASAAVTAAIYVHTDEKRKAEAIARVL